jgi:hypothetical protein
MCCPGRCCRAAAWLLILGFACLRPAQARELPVRWALLIAIYALAKLLELGDHAVYEWTGQLVSGHSLKHMVAAFAAWPVVTALLAAAEIQGRIQCTIQKQSRPVAPAQQPAAQQPKRGVKHEC